MRKKVKKIAVLTLGIVFILLGLIGLVLPFLQGILFLVIGFTLIFFYFPEGRLWLNKYTEKYPRLFLMIEKIEKWLVKVIGEI